MKKVLIVTYFWPPAGGIGVLRCLKIAKYLRAFDWEPVIFTVKDPYYPFIDEGNNKDIPENIEVIREKAFDVEKVFKKIIKKEKQSINNVVFSAGKTSPLIKFGLWLRGNYFIPDAKYKWIKPSVKRLSTYLEDNKIDAIFSDGPPHTNTVIAQIISSKYKIPWLSDYQDPWTQVDYYSKFPLSKRADRKHKELERKAVITADKIVSASPSFSKGLEELGAKNTSVIYYGYDEDDFKDIVPQLDSKFTIIHAGILSADRLPENLLNVLRDLSNENKLFKSKLQLKLIGSVDEDTLNKIKKVIPKENLLCTGLIPRSEVLQLISNTQLLLNLVNKENSKGRIPGKIYEYFRVRRPIISIGNKEGDVAELILKTDSGVCFEYEEYETLKKHIKRCFLMYLKGELLPTKGDITEYSNYNQTKKIAKFLNKITNGRTK